MRATALQRETYPPVRIRGFSTEYSEVNRPSNVCLQILSSATSILHPDSRHQIEEIIKLRGDFDGDRFTMKGLTSNYSLGRTASVGLGNPMTHTVYKVYYAVEYVPGDIP